MTSEAEWFREQLAAIFGKGGQSALARFLKTCGDPRSYETILRTIQNQAAGRYRLSGEMRVLLVVLRHPETLPDLVRTSGREPPAHKFGTRHPLRHGEMERLDMSDLETDVARRLKALMAELDIDGRRGLAELCGASISQANNWLIEGNLPRVPEMIRLCEQTGITLDWLYRGHMGAMDVELGSRLAKRLGATGSGG